MHITSKELAYISDSIKNEDLLTKLCVQGAVECQDQQLGHFMEQLANSRFGVGARLHNKLQEKANTPH